MKISAVYGYSFIKARLGYFGALSFDNNGVYFKGSKKSFLMKNIPIDLFFELSSIQQIKVKWTKVTVVTKQRSEVFNLAVLYNSIGIDTTEYYSNMAVGGGSLGLAIRDIIKSRRYDAAEKEITDFHMGLLSSVYSSRTTPQITGLKKSQITLFTALFWIAVTCTILGLLIIALVKIQSKISSYS